MKTLITAVKAILVLIVISISFKAMADNTWPTYTWKQTYTEPEPHWFVRVETPDNFYWAIEDGSIIDSDAMGLATMTAVDDCISTEGPQCYSTHISWRANNKEFVILATDYQDAIRAANEHRKLLANPGK